MEGSTQTASISRVLVCCAFTFAARLPRLPIRIRIAFCVRRREQLKTATSLSVWYGPVWRIALVPSSRVCERPFDRAAPDSRRRIRLLSVRSLEHGSLAHDRPCHRARDHVQHRGPCSAAPGGHVRGVRLRVTPTATVNRRSPDPADN